MSTTGKLLQVRDLAVHFSVEGEEAKAVDGVSFEVGRGETFGLVGESGCGKSVTALSIMGLVDCPPGRIVSGEILMEGEDLLGFSAAEMRCVRGNRVSMVFQEPMTSLNPVFTVGNQIMEAVRLHRGVGRREAREAALSMLRRVRIPEPEQRFSEYPHQMSGGMKQRVMIAMAMVSSPALLIADEPTTALDVTIQAQILELMKELTRDLGMSTLLITHDLGVVAEVADNVAVMYAGRIVEYADVRSIFHDPQHPYMVSLFRSMPVIGSAGKRLDVIPGQVPDPRRHPTGCRFHPRCYMAVDECARIAPELREVKPGHMAACIRLPGYADAPSVPHVAAGELDQLK